MTNKMKEIFVEKIVLNMGIGPEPNEIKKAQTIMERLAGQKPVQTKAKIKQPSWGLRPGIPIGLKVTLRKQRAQDFLVNALKAKDPTLRKKNFDRNGNFGFGIKEYIDRPGTKYDPQLGVRGFDVLVSLNRPGFRVKKRKINTKVGKKHLITRDDAIGFMKEKYKIEVE